MRFRSVARVNGLPVGVRKNIPSVAADDGLQLRRNPQFKVLLCLLLLKDEIAILDVVMPKLCNVGNALPRIPKGS
jgi:hypothetical protein